MGVKTISLVLNEGRTVYYAGQVITGFCQVDVSDDPLPGVELRFSGKARTHITERHSTGSGDNRRIVTRHYYESRKLFRYDIRLTDPYSEQLIRGVHQLPFSIQLPHNINGSISYHLRAKPPANWIMSMFKPKAKQDIAIVQFIDTNLSQYQFPVAGKDSKTKCCWCCASGPITISAQTDRAAYCANEVVQIMAVFENNSSSKATPYAKLQQNTTCHAKGHVRTTSESWDIVPINGSTSLLRGGDMTGWEGTQLTMPGCTPSVSLDIISVSYLLEIGLDIAWAFDLKVYLPVVIGTVPFRSQPSLTNQQPLPGLAGQDRNIPIGPWAGVGRNSGIAPPSAPPLPAGDFQVDNAPPDYFSTYFSQPVQSLPKSA